MFVCVHVLIYKIELTFKLFKWMMINFIYPQQQRIFSIARYGIKLCIYVSLFDGENKKQKKKVDNEQWSVYNCVKMFEGCSDFVLKFTFFLIIMCFFGFQIFFNGQSYEFRIMNYSITIISSENVRTTKIITYFIDLPYRKTSGMK